MFKEMKKRIKNEKGLTLIELLAVIVILAIIAAIAIPAIGNIIGNSKIKALKSDAANIISSAQIYYTDGNTAGFTLGGADATGKDYITLSSTATTISVTKDGKISGTLATKDNYKIVMASATLADLKIDSPGANGALITVTKP